MVAEPEKELRFTRSGQAVGFCVAGAVLVGVAVTLIATGVHRPENPELPHPAWAVPCVLLAAGAFLLARRLAKHAYLILTPMGLEIFPLLRPAAGMRVLYWQEIRAAEIDGSEKWLTLHTNEERTAGVRVSLAPVRKRLRALLAKAVTGRVNA